MNTSAKYLMIEQLNLLKDLTENQKNDIAQFGSFLKLKKDQKVYEADQPIRSVYILLKGSIKVGLEMEPGKSIIKQLIREGEIFGENILTKKENRPDYAQALIESQVLVIPKGKFETILFENSKFCTSIVSHIMSQLSDLEKRVADFVYVKAQKRIEGFLKKMAINRGIKIGIDELLIKHNLSHSDIAFITDTSRQTVSRVLGELKRSNIIHFSARKPNKILVRNMAQLA